MEPSLPISNFDLNNVASQPAFKEKTPLNSNSSPLKEKKNNADLLGCYSQPAAMMSDQFNSCTQPGTQSQITNVRRLHQRLIKRHTRFWTEKSYNKASSFLKLTLERMRYGVKNPSRGVYVVETVDKRGAKLVFRVSFIELEGRILLDFRLSSGCGLEFKRHFAKIKENSEEIVANGPLLWPALIPVDAIPGKV